MNQRYVYVPAQGEPFNTEWFQPENHYNEGDKVFDLATGKYYDGEWKPIKEDHL